MSSAGTGAPAPSAAPASAAAAGGGAAQQGGGGGRSGPPNYHRLERLGKGSFATVRACVCDGLWDRVMWCLDRLASHY